MFDRDSLIYFRRHDKGIPLVVTVAVIDHAHQAICNQRAHLIALMNGAGDSLLFPVLHGIVKTDERVILWNMFAHL